MPTKTSSSLQDKTCEPCHANTPPLTEAEKSRLIRQVENWRMADDGDSISREYEVKDFASGIDFLRRVAEVAEQEGHHPDLHLTDFRKVVVRLSTHAIHGLSENDFIVAAKIDALPVALKKKAH